MAAVSISLEPNLPAEGRDALWQGLFAYNREHIADDHVEHLYLVLRDDAGGIVGGLLGDCYWNWLHVELLWLAEAVRREGWGSRLLKRAEEEALARGCTGVHLDTFSFQALPFYRKHGYEVFGEIDGFPGGHRRYYLKKMLQR